MRGSLVEYGAASGTGRPTEMAALKILVAMPALNERQTIGVCLEQLSVAGAGIGTEDADLAILVVDDGSTDGTGDIARAAGAAVIRHPTPRGVGGAFHSAVDHALRTGADVMVTIDADGQFDPDQIAEIVAPILAGEADFVTGTRFEGGRRPRGMPMVKFLGNRFFTGVLNFFVRQELTDVSCGFRAYSREALYHLNLFGKFTYTQETIFDLAFKNLRIVEVPIRVTYDPNRRSRVAKSLVWYGVNALSIVFRTARDFKPLRFFGALGMLVFLIGVVLDVGLLIYFARTGGFTPYKFVGFTGAALNVLGILIAGVAVVADMLDRIRGNQERLLYLQRRTVFGGSKMGPFPTDGSRARSAPPVPPAPE